MNSDQFNDAPRTLDSDGRVPETRMQSAREVSSRIKLMQDADSSRALRRQTVKGLVDGNPPYRSSDLRNAGRAHQCNVNWRVAEKYLNQARSAFYDVFSEAPNYATVQYDQGNTTDENVVWSQIATEEFEWLNRQDDGFDYSMRISQRQE